MSFAPFVRRNSGLERRRYELARLMNPALSSQTVPSRGAMFDTKDMARLAKFRKRPTIRAASCWLLRHLAPGLAVDDRHAAVARVDRERTRACNCGGGGRSFCPACHAYRRSTVRWSASGGGVRFGAVHMDLAPCPTALGFRHAQGITRGPPVASGLVCFRVWPCPGND